MASARRTTAKPAKTKASAPIDGFALLERLMKEVGPPRDLATKLVAEASVLDAATHGKPIERWKQLGPEVLRVWLAMLVARTRAMKEARSQPAIRTRVHSIITRYPAWAKEHRPGHVNGMQVEHQPEHGSWGEDARVYWAALTRLLAAKAEEPAKLDELVKQATSRALSLPEIDELCRLAVATGRSSSVVVDLMSARTEAARTNLKAAPALTAPHAARRHRPRAKVKEVPNRESTRALSLPFAVTDHAFDRFAERHRPNEPAESVAAFLTAEAATAKPIRERTISGEEQWVSASGISFVLRRDGGGSLPVCVTVLPRQEDRPVGHKPRH